MNLMIYERRAPPRPGQPGGGGSLIQKENDVDDDGKFPSTARLTNNNSGTMRANTQLFATSDTGAAERRSRTTNVNTAHPPISSQTNSSENNQNDHMSM